MQPFSETASKSARLEFCSQVEPDTHTHRQTHTHTHRQSAVKIKTPPRFRGGVIKQELNVVKILNPKTSKNWKKKQEAFRERRHLHVCDLWPWRVTLTLLQGQESLCHWMLHIILYLSIRYDVYGFITLQHIPICLLYVTLDLHLWPSSSVKVTVILIIICILCCCMFVPKMKSVGSVEFEIWTFVYRKIKWRHYDVITHLILMLFTYISANSICRRHTKFHFDQT